MELKLNWLQCQGDVWCKLSTVNLAHAHFNNLQGVYIIWHGGATPATVFVGHGVIRDRLNFHRKDPTLQPFETLGLYVTWALVLPLQWTGVEAYLTQRLSPKVRSGGTTNVTPITVNLPW